MSFEVGNQFWKQRSKHGRDKLFATPELLWEAACEYFEWCDNNPWITKKTKSKITTNGEGSEEEETPTQRPYSLGGFCLYIGASEEYWREFRKANHSDYFGVIKQIEGVIDTQQFEGATVGAFNANIIARKLGLKEQTENTTTLNANFSLNKMKTTKETFASNENDIE